MPPNNNAFIELEVQPTEPTEPMESISTNTDTSTFTNNTNTSDCFTYQYNLYIGDSFDDWESVNRFMHEYCLERGFGYQIYRNDKDSHDHTITRRKSFRCSSSGSYEARKEINQNVHR